MDLAQILIALIVVGAVLYIVSLLPLDSTIKNIINVIAVVVLAVWLIRAFVPALGLG